MTRLVAVLAIETGIAPNDLMAADPAVQEAIIDVLQERAEEQKRQRLQNELKARLRR